MDHFVVVVMLRNHVFIYNCCNKLDHLKPYYYVKSNELRWS